MDLSCKMNTFLEFPLKSTSVSTNQKRKPQNSTARMRQCLHCSVEMAGCPVDPKNGKNLHSLPQRWAGCSKRWSQPPSFWPIFSWRYILLLLRPRICYFSRAALFSFRYYVKPVLLNAALQLPPNEMTVLHILQVFILFSVILVSNVSTEFPMLMAQTTCVWHVSAFWNTFKES